MLRLKSFAMPTTNHTKPLTCSASRSRKSSRSSTTAATDRKSTRLNSSHLVISYAVFCLKKKKNYLPPLLAFDATAVPQPCRVNVVGRRLLASVRHSSFDQSECLMVSIAPLTEVHIMVG